MQPIALLPYLIALAVLQTSTTQVVVSAALQPSSAATNGAVQIALPTVLPKKQGTVITYRIPILILGGKKPPQICVIMRQLCAGKTLGT